MVSERVEDEGDLTFDDIASRLQNLRAEAGLPSYNEIVVRIAAAREREGASPSAARPARTTVYDAFRPGRRRLDPRLLGEIVRALGVDGSSAEVWESDVRRARAVAEHSTRVTGPAPTPAHSPTSPAPGDAPEPARSRPVPLRPGVVVALLVGTLALNLLGRILVDTLGLTIYLDMTGTAIAAVAIGPWWGALVGVLTNLVGVSVSGAVSSWFAPVNVVGALLWGYGVRRLGFGRSLPRFFMLTVMVAVACSAVAAPIIVALDGGVRHHSEALVDQVDEVFGFFLASLLTVNLLMSMLDKLLSGFLALVAAEALRRPVLGAHPLVPEPPCRVGAD